MRIESFLESLSTRTWSAETLRAYRQDLTRFETFLKEKGLPVNEVKPATISEFMNYMAENKGRTASTTLAPSTVARRLSVISAYYEWVRDDSGATIRNPVERIKRPKVRNEKPRAAPDDVLATLVDGITDLRDRAVVLLFLYSGLRLSELRQLDKTTITLTSQQMPDGSSQYLGIGEVLGKGNKKRSFLVGPKAMLAVATYIAQQRMKDDEPALFLSSRKKRLSGRAIQQIVDKWCDRLGVAHLHVHQFRHSFATRNVNAGMSAAVLQELMGHASLTTTQRYFHMKPERLSREYFAAMEFTREFSPV
ncbi:tyrosine-type recombinase/integrase [Tunturiibacter gelidoferens]|uniref:Tyrosine-type recombinase/integrase n=1 Tax=Tunturiibacter gelidiferens TaxID=3069689 RepID=A0AAU7Z3R5_9BACT